MLFLKSLTSLVYTRHSWSVFWGTYSEQKNNSSCRYYDMKINSNISHQEIKISLNQDGNREAVTPTNTLERTNKHKFIHVKIPFLHGTKSARAPQHTQVKPTNQWQNGTCAAVLDNLKHMRKGKPQKKLRHLPAVQRNAFSLDYFNSLDCIILIYVALNWEG